MADIVNLNKFRKARKKAEKPGQAAANRLRFSRNKAEKSKDAAETAKRDETLDGARLDGARLDGADTD